MKANRRLNSLLLAGLFVLLAILPKLLSEYLLSLVITMIIYSLFAVSFNILFGYAGLLTFGHAAYFGIGAYLSIISYKFLGLPLLAGILLGGVAGSLLGACFGVFLARFRGMTFALLTVAFNQFIFTAAEKWRSVTSGDDGMSGQRPDLFLPGIGSIDMLSQTNWYYFVVIIVVLSMAYCYFFTRTPLGQLNVCIRENEERAGFIGYNTYAAKLAVYVLSSFFAGLAGALASAYQEFVATSFIHLDKGADVLIMTFVGGSTTFWGPILGVCFLTYFNDLLSSATKHWRIVQGVMFIILVIYAPQGISGLLLQVKEWFKNRAGAGKGIQANVEGVDQ
jgi:branched-chain amino acid transport system permease protein